MANKKDIKEGAKFLTLKDSAGKGRIGVAYAVSDNKIEQGTVDLFFKGGGSVIDGVDYMPPSGIFKVKHLELIK